MGIYITTKKAKVEGESMKRVGIMTWYYGANYGALAQSLALYKTIQSLGYECELIDYKPKTYIKTIRNSNLPKRKEFYRLDRWVTGLQKIIKLSTTDYFSVSDRVRTVEDINSQNYNVVVFGSDAIFNIDHPLCDSLYYGVGIKKRKITYSPSCEYLSPNTKLPVNYVKSIKEMTTVSVRDVNTYELIKNNVGIEPQITLDPTFLYSFSEIGQTVCSDKYLFVYSFSNWNEHRNKIISFAAAHSLKIVCIGQKVNWADISIENASFEQWIQAFRDAELVVTDSFHGTVFALKNKKQIVICGRADKKAKISSLLGQFGITIEIYKGEEIDVYLSQNSICYETKQEKIDAEIAQSFEYLKNALENE